MRCGTAALRHTECPTSYRHRNGKHAFLEAKYGLGGILSSLPVFW